MQLSLLSFAQTNEFQLLSSTIEIIGILLLYFLFFFGSALKTLGIMRDPLCVSLYFDRSKRHKSGSMEDEVDSPGGEYYHSPSSPASSSRNWTDDMEGGQNNAAVQVKKDIEISNLLFPLKSHGQLPVNRFYSN